MKPCPTCGKPGPVVSVTRERIPVLQNVVYETRDGAIAAPSGALALATCGACGFSFNAEFAPDLAVYDGQYDNFVASNIFRRYYQDVARMLLGQVDLAGGTVYEIGCGDGEFLRTLCAMAPISGVGVDPSCRPERGANWELIPAKFDHALLRDRGPAKLIVVRHVLEHLADPVGFLRELRRAVPDAPLYVEVPDLDWILEEGALWDFCYEHCNYFTPQTLACALIHAQFQPYSAERSFGGQYQWSLSLPTDSEGSPPPDEEREVRRLASYAAQEGLMMQKIADEARDSGGVVVWGMATKGVMLSNLIPGRLVLGGVDMNKAKQGKFASLSGLEIHGPDWLCTVPSGSRVLVMNPNYLSEVRDIVDRLGLALSIESVGRA